MISLEASPRSPRRVAEDMMRRARETGDLDMWHRGKRAMQYAEDLEARRRPSQVYGQIDHDRYEEGGPASRKASEVGQVLGFTVASLYTSCYFFGLFETAVGFFALCFAGIAVYAARQAIKSARQ